MYNKIFTEIKNLLEIKKFLLNNCPPSLTKNEKALIDNYEDQRHLLDMQYQLNDTEMLCYLHHLANQEEPIILGQESPLIPDTQDG
jgi:hypothetical protein